MVKYVTFDQSYVFAVARLHQRTLDGFLSRLGKDFLNHFYQSSLQVPEMVAFVALEKEKVVGFATGVTRADGLMKKIIRQDLGWFSFFFVKYFFLHPQDAWKAVQSMKYPGFSQQSAELLSLAVDSSHQGQGIGKKICSAVAQEFAKRGLSSFEVSAYDRLPANGFYTRIGCKKIRSFMFLGEKMNYYSCDVSVCMRWSSRARNESRDLFT